MEDCKEQLRRTLVALSVLPDRFEKAMAPEHRLYYQKTINHCHQQHQNKSCAEPYQELYDWLHHFLVLELITKETYLYHLHHLKNSEYK